jgi:hypothetical protein
MTGQRPAHRRSFGVPVSPWTEDGAQLQSASSATTSPGYGVHSGGDAAESAAHLGARAYTFDQHIVLRSADGARLMAHELAHVHQQFEGRAVGVRRQAEPEENPDAFESEAEAAADSMTRGSSTAGLAPPDTAPLALGPGSGPPGAAKGGGQPRSGFGLTVRSPVPCVPTATNGTTITSSTAIEVSYFKNHDDAGTVSLRDREAGDATLQAVSIPRTPRSGQVSFAASIAIGHEDHHYEPEMVLTNRNGVIYGGLGRLRQPIQFEVAHLSPKPKGEHLLFAKAIYAEGVDAREFLYVRDLVYNRIDWVKGCPGDADTFGSTITTTLSRPGQFASVSNKSAKFQELEMELNLRSGLCHYTTPPRAGSPARARLINAAIDAEAAGNGKSHDYLFFRSDTDRPSPRAVAPPWRYPGGNYYWRISGCPPEKQPK